MPTLYLLEQYSIVKLEGDALRIDIPADKHTDRPKSFKRVPLIHVDQVVAYGEITFTSSALGALLERRVSTHFLTLYGRSRGSLVPDPTKNAALRLGQYQACINLSQRFNLARQCIDGKLKNMRTQLQRFNRKYEHPQLEASINELHHVRQHLENINPPEQLDPTDRMHGMGQLFGAEGAGSAAYWRAFAHLLQPPWQWNGRKRRPPPDPVNALLSFGYVILTNQAVSQLALVGLDPYIGFLHRPGFGKPALALDLVEEFRTPIVESTVLTVLNTGILTPDDFLEDHGSVRLKDAAKKTFLTKLEERFTTEIQHPVFNYKVTYRRCLELQARLLGKTVMGEIPCYPPFITR